MTDRKKLNLREGKSTTRKLTKKELAQRARAAKKLKEKDDE